MLGLMSDPFGRRRRRAMRASKSAPKRHLAAGISLLACLAASGRPTVAATAERDLSRFAGPDQTFTITIALDISTGTFLAGVEDAPPPGWVVTNITDGGGWDALNAEVKWLFFDPSIPSSVSYDVTPPMALLGLPCFIGTVAVDALSEPIQGDQCAGAPVPMASTFGTVALLGLVIAAVWVVVVSDPWPPRGASP